MVLLESKRRYMWREQSMCFRHATLSHGPCACTSCSHDERKGTGSHDLLSSSHTREPFSHLALEVSPFQLAPWRAGRAEPLSRDAGGARPRVPLLLDAADSRDAQTSHVRATDGRRCGAAALGCRRHELDVGVVTRRRTGAST